MNLKIIGKFAIALILAFGAMAASADIFLRVPGVDGESTAVGYEDWIVIEAMSIGFADRTCSGISLVKSLDRASPALSASAITGQLFPSMTLAVTKASLGPGAAGQYLTLVMTNVVVSAVSVSGASTSGPPFESLSLQAGVVTMVYRPQRSDGTLGSPIESILTCGKFK
jgi:type VI protein secretion system component Hcp